MAAESFVGWVGGTNHGHLYLEMLVVLGKAIPQRRVISNMRCDQPPHLGYEVHVFTSNEASQLIGISRQIE